MSEIAPRSLEEMYQKIEEDKTNTTSPNILDRFMGMGMAAGSILSAIDSLNELLNTVKASDQNIGIEPEAVDKMLDKLTVMAMKQQSYIDKEIKGIKL